MRVIKFSRTEAGMNSCNLLVSMSFLVMKKILFLSSSSPFSFSHMDSLNGIYIASDRYCDDRIVRPSFVRRLTMTFFLDIAASFIN